MADRSRAEWPPARPWRIFPAIHDLQERFRVTGQFGQHDHRQMIPPGMPPLAKLGMSGVSVEGAKLLHKHPCRFAG